MKISFELDSSGRHTYRKLNSFGLKIQNKKYLIFVSNIQLILTVHISLILCSIMENKKERRKKGEEIQRVLAKEKNRESPKVKFKHLKISQA